MAATEPLPSTLRAPGTGLRGAIKRPAARFDDFRSEDVGISSELMILLTSTLREDILLPTEQSLGS